MYLYNRNMIYLRICIIILGQPNSRFTTSLFRVTSGLFRDFYYFSSKILREKLNFENIIWTTLKQIQPKKAICTINFTTHLLTHSPTHHFTIFAIKLSEKRKAKSEKRRAKSQEPRAKSDNRQLTTDNGQQKTDNRQQIWTISPPTSPSAF